METRYRHKSTVVEAFKVYDFRIALNWLEMHDVHYNNDGVTYCQGVEGDDYLIIKTSAGYKQVVIGDVLLAKDSGGIEVMSAKDFSISYEPMPASEAHAYKTAVMILDLLKEQRVLPENFGLYAESEVTAQGIAYLVLNSRA